MEIAVTFLKSNNDFYKTIDLINQSSADFLHVDVIDGLFVNNTTPFDKNKLDVLKKKQKEKRSTFNDFALRKVY